MRLAISNIAWRADEEPQVARLLTAMGVDAVELAPGRAVADPANATEAQAVARRDWWAAQGVQVVALQALLFGQTGLALFEADAARHAMARHLHKILQLAAWLGARRLVFGSPGQRKRGAMPHEQAMEIATAFFRDLGQRAADLGVQLCIEPNPPHYGCDFVTTSVQGRELVQRVDSPGFGLHLDAAGIALAGEDPSQAVRGAGVESIRHFHLSAPDLGHVDRSCGIDYARLLGTLRDLGYPGYVSIEMRQREGTANLPFVAESLGFIAGLLA